MSEQDHIVTTIISQASALIWDEAPFLAAPDAAVTALSEHAASLDALNVFPVADGDTGTNLLLTARAALRPARNVAGEGLPAVTEAAARAALCAAHGNSGVILSQAFRAFTKGDARTYGAGRFRLQRHPHSRRYARSSCAASSRRGHYDHGVACPGRNSGISR